MGKSTFCNIIIVITQKYFRLKTKKGCLATKHVQDNLLLIRIFGFNAYRWVLEISFVGLNKIGSVSTIQASLIVFDLHYLCGLIFVIQM